MLTAELLREELKHCSEDIVLNLRLVLQKENEQLRKEFEQHFGEQAVHRQQAKLGRESAFTFQSLPSFSSSADSPFSGPRNLGSITPQSNKQFVRSTSARFRGQRGSMPIMQEDDISPANRGGHSYKSDFGGNSRTSIRHRHKTRTFSSDDELSKLSVAMSPHLLPWKRHNNSQSFCDARRPGGASQPEAVDSHAEHTADSSPLSTAGAVSPTSGTMSPTQVQKTLEMSWPASLRKDISSSLNSAVKRRSWHSHHHRSSFRELALAHERMQSEGETYQLLPPSSDGAFETEMEAGGVTKTNTCNHPEHMRPNRTMKEDSLATDGWMHRFRKGNTRSSTTDLAKVGATLMLEAGTELTVEQEESIVQPRTCSHWFCSACASCTACCRGFGRLEDFVSSAQFDLATAALVIINAASIGIQTNYMAVHWSQGVPGSFRHLEKIFCILFAVELAFRVFAYGCRFLYMAGWHWNLFDVTMVVLQVTEVALEPAFEKGGDPTWDHWSSFRTLRLIRIIRLARILHLMSELRTLVVSISHSIRSLGWVMLLLLVMIYVLAVYLTQIVTDHKVFTKEPIEEEHALLQFYGSLDRSVLSLYAMVSEGIHWDALMDPLAEHISPWLRLVFFFFSAFAIFAVMNVVTGVFVESAITTATEDRKMSIASSMRRMFCNIDHDNSNDITWEEFRDHLMHPEMQTCLREMDVSHDDASELFRLLDIDSSGTIDVDELVHGCLRLMGGAKAIDLATFMNEYRIVTMHWVRHAQFVEECMDMIDGKLNVLMGHDPGLHICKEEDEEEFVGSQPLSGF